MKKIHEDIREIAENILENFAQRKLRAGKKNIYFTDTIQEFQENFPYNYTQDQEQSIDDIFQDMLSEKNMDRLLV
jgi:transcription-repair coupling factor (superfamily II helicase)